MAGTVVEELVALLGYEIRDNGAVEKFEGKLKSLEKRVEGIGRAIGTGMMVVGTAVAAGLGFLGKSALSTGATFEALEVRLEALEGSSEKAKQALNWVQDFAGQTPLSLSEAANAYASLKTFGIDPTNGSMMAAVDTMAMAGQKADYLNGIILAMGQAWTKGKLQGEEALQLIERGVPVWDLLAKAMGKSTAEVQELSSKGKLGKKEMQLLFDAMGKRAQGASIKAAKTWDGIVDRFGDKWEKFLKLIADNGYFDAAKKKLEGVAEIVDGWFDDGTAETVARELSGIFIAITDVVGAVVRQMGGHIKYLVQNWSSIRPVAMGLASVFGVLAVAARPVMAIFTALALIVDDFLTWMEGGDSLIGRFAKQLQELTGLSEGAANKLAGIGAALTAAFSVATIGSISTILGKLLGNLTGIGNSAGKIDALANSVDGLNNKTKAAGLLKVPAAWMVLGRLAGMGVLAWNIANLPTDEEGIQEHFKNVQKNADEANSWLQENIGTPSSWLGLEEPLINKAIGDREHVGKAQTEGRLGKNWLENYKAAAGITSGENAAASIATDNSVHTQTVTVSAPVSVHVQQAVQAAAAVGNAISAATTSALNATRLQDSGVQ